MWLLVFILMQGPFQIEMIDVMGTYSSRDDCVNDSKKMRKHLPAKSSLGCVPLLSVKKV
jgi:hypothetical protein